MILHAIYDAALDDAAFLALPALMAAELGARSATIQMFNTRRELIDVAHCYASDAMMSYFVQEKVWEHDVWADIAFRPSNAGRAVSTEDFISVGEFKGTTMYNDFFRRFGDDTARCMGTNVAMGTGSFQLGFHRADRAGTFTPEEVAALDRLTPHFRRSMTMRERLRRAEGEAKDRRNDLDRIGTALLRLDRFGRVSFMNAAAERLMAQANGLALRHGRIVLDGPTAQSALDRVIQASTARTTTHGGGLRVAKRNDSGFYRMLVIPPRAFSGQGAIVLVDDPATAGKSSAALITSVFGLTEAETRVSLGLVRGDTPEEIAQAHGVGITTVRSQVRSILMKTGRRRITEAVVDMARLAALVSDD